MQATSGSITKLQVKKFMQQFLKVLKIQKNQHRLYTV